MFWTIALPALEAGTWLGWLIGKAGSHDRVRERLINGTQASREIKLLDKQLERETLSATLLQRKAAAGITRGLRFVAGTRALELVILKMTQAKWPGQNKPTGKARFSL
jgi:hypothetical protein